MDPTGIFNISNQTVGGQDQTPTEGKPLEKRWQDTLGVMGEKLLSQGSDQSKIESIQGQLIQLLDQIDRDHPRADTMKKTAVAINNLQLFAALNAEEKGTLAKLGFPISDFSDDDDATLSGLQQSFDAMSVVKAPAVLQAFQPENGSNLVELPDALEGCKNRDDYKARIAAGAANPVALFGPAAVAVAEPVSTTEFAEYCEANRKDLALGEKYLSGDNISNQMGALAGFAYVATTKAFLFSDFCWMGHASRSPIVPFEGNKCRPVIISATTQPDLELGGASEVTMRPFELPEDGLQANQLTAEELNDIPTAEDLKNKDFREQYDVKLLRHQLHFLTDGIGLPPKFSVTAKDSDQVVQELNEGNLTTTAFKESYISLKNGKILSAKAMFMYSKLQLQNELKSLHSHDLPYCYTVDPAAIFLGAFNGNRDVFNRIHAMALKEVLDENPELGTHLKTVAFNNFADPIAPEFYNKLLNPENRADGIECMPKSNIFARNGVPDTSKIPGQILVLHNNSDRFGDNISHEGFSSLDGAFAVYSTAAPSLGVRAARQYLGS